MVKGVVVVADAGLLAGPVGLAVEDEFVGGGLEPVDGGLGEERVGHQPEPLDRLAVGGDDGGGGAVAFDDELVDVGGVEGVEGLEGEVIDDAAGRRAGVCASRRRGCCRAGWRGGV